MNSFFITILVLGIVFPILIAAITYKGCAEEILPVALFILGIFYWIAVLGPIGSVYYSKQYAKHRDSITSGLDSFSLYKIIKEAKTSKDRWELKNINGSRYRAKLIDHKLNKTYYIVIDNNSIFRLWDAELKIIIDEDIVVYSDNTQDGLNLHPDPAARCIMIDLIYKEFEAAIKAQEMLRYKEATSNSDLFKVDATVQPQILKEVNEDNINIKVQQGSEERDVILDVIPYGKVP